MDSLRTPNYMFRDALKAETYQNLKALHAYYVEKSLKYDTFCGFDLLDLIHWIKLELERRKR